MREKEEREIEKDAVDQALGPLPRGLGPGSCHWARSKRGSECMNTIPGYC